MKAFLRFTISKEDMLRIRNEKKLTHIFLGGKKDNFFEKITLGEVVEIDCEEETKKQSVFGRAEEIEENKGKVIYKIRIDREWASKQGKPIDAETSLKIIEEYLAGYKEDK